MKKNFLLGILLYSTTSIAQIPTTGLVAYYPFTGNAADSSGNANNGTVNGATLTPDRFGNSNSAYNFSGSSYIQVANNSLLNFGTGSFAISTWVNSSIDSSQMIIHKGSDFSFPQYFLRINENDTTDLRFLTSSGLPNDSYNTEALNVSIENNQWHHIVAQRKVDTLQLYFDNVLIYSNQKTLRNVNNNLPLLIGAQNSTNLSNFFKGKIDDVAIYNRALTTAEIQQLYTVGCNGVSASITAYGNTTFCNGSNVLLVAASGNIGYQWQKNGVNISGANASSYTASATASYRCVVSCGFSTATSNAIAVTKINNASVIVSASGSTTFCAGSSVALNGTNPGAGYIYQWYRNNISINGATTLGYIAYNPGSYKMVTTNAANGCSRISNTITITVNCRIANPEIISGSIQQENKLTLYPNPTSGSFTIELNDEENVEGGALIQLFNTDGQKIFQSTEQIEKGQLEKEIGFEKNFKNGLYILKMVIGNKIYETKVMIN